MLIKKAKCITYCKECNELINKKDATDRKRRNILYYQKDKDYVINRKLNNYYKMKDVSSEGNECGYKHMLFWVVSCIYILTNSK